MYTVLICAVVFLTAALALFRRTIKDPFTQLMCVATVAFGAFVGIGIAKSIGDHFPICEVPIKEVKLVSLSASDASSGSFFLGTGAVNDHQYYFFFQRVGSGFALEKLDAGGVTIYEQNRTDGRLVTMRARFKNPEAWHWAIPNKNPISYAFYVPNGVPRRTLS